MVIKIVTDWVVSDIYDFLLNSKQIGVEEYALAWLKEVKREIEEEEGIELKGKTIQEIIDELEKHDILLYEYIEADSSVIEEILDRVEDRIFHIEYDDDDFRIMEFPVEFLRKIRQRS